jgi:hypothetical protein
MKKKIGEDDYRKNFAIMVPANGVTLRELWESKSVFTGLSPKDRGLSFEEFEKQFNEGPFGHSQNKTNNNEANGTTNI